MSVRSSSRDRFCSTPRVTVLTTLPGWRRVETREPDTIRRFVPVRIGSLRKVRSNRAVVLPPSGSAAVYSVAIRSSVSSVFAPRWVTRTKDGVTQLSGFIMSLAPIVPVCTRTTGTSPSREAGSSERPSGGRPTIGSIGRPCR